MPLTSRQRRNTIAEFAHNIHLLGLTYEQIALDLGTVAWRIEDIAHLSNCTIEEPWILRNYLIEQAKSRGIKLFPFTALAGDPHDYWFLNTGIIERGIIS